MNIPIHVAIPVFNNADGVRNLLKQLTVQNFASITVLDDASTDHINDVLNEFPQVFSIQSKENLGTVGANNLILQKMPTDGFLLCIDSDMQMLTEDVPGTLSDFVATHQNVGAGVGKIIGADAKRIRWNFNYDINPVRGVFAFVAYHLALLLVPIPLLGDMSRKISTLFTAHLADDNDQKVDWGIEAFFFVRCDLFNELRGFDSRFKRFHEGPDLFLQIRKLGFETWFTNNIVALDTDQGSGSSLFRRYHWWRSLIIYFWKNPSRLIIYRWPRP